MTTINDLDDFKALEPFFRIIQEALDGGSDLAAGFGRCGRSCGQRDS